MRRPDRLAMVDRGHAAVSVRRQCALLGVARAGVYRPALAPGPEDLALMRRLDALYLEAPFYGSRRMVEALRRDGVRVGRHRVRRLMRLMGLQALAPKPGTSRPAPDHRIYLYLLRGLTIERPNQVWAADGPRLFLSGGDHRLVLAGCPGMAAVEHDGRPVLRRGSGGGAGAFPGTGH